MKKGKLSVVLMCVVMIAMLVSSISVFAISDESLTPITYVNLLPETEDEMEEYWEYNAGGNGDNVEMTFEDGAFVVQSGDEATWPWVKLLGTEFVVDASKDIFIYYDVDVSGYKSGEIFLTANCSPNVTDGAEDDANRATVKITKDGNSKGSMSIKKIFEDAGLIENNELLLNAFRIQMVGATNTTVKVKQFEIRCGTQAEADAYDPSKETPKPTPTIAPSPTVAPTTAAPTPTIAPSPTTPKGSATAKANTNTPGDKDTDNTDEGFPTWAIVVIIVAVVAIAGGLTYYFVVVKKKKQQ